MELILKNKKSPDTVINSQVTPPKLKEDQPHPAIVVKSPSKEEKTDNEEETELPLEGMSPEEQKKFFLAQLQQLTPAIPDKSTFLQRRAGSVMASAYTITDPVQEDKKANILKKKLADEQAKISDIENKNNQLEFVITELEAAIQTIIDEESRLLVEKELINTQIKALETEIDEIKSKTRTN